jgi:hypothetical protein
LIFTPPALFAGTTRFTYRATDGLQTGKPTEVTVTIRPSVERRWINPAGGNWSVAANWLNGVIPGADDIAVIAEPGSYAVNVDVNATVSQLRLGGDSGTQTLSPNSSRTLTVLNGGSGGAGGRLQLNAGAVAVGGSLSIGTVSVGGGTLTGSGSLTASAGFLWTSGTMTGTGRLVVGPLATGAISGGGGKTLDGGRQLINEGNLTLSGASLNFSNGNGGNATFDNRGTFAVTDEADFTFSNFNGQPVFVLNSGTFEKSGTATTTVLGPSSVANTGTIRVVSGTLRFSASTSHAGPLEIAAGARVELTGGTFTCAAGATLGTLGEFVLQGAALAVAANLEMPRLSFASGTLSGSAILTVTETFSWTGGTMNGTGSLVIGPLATGAISGGAGKSLDGGRQLLNEGDLTLSGATVDFSNGGGANATFDNRGTFTVTDEADFTWSNFNGQPVFVKNSGTFVKSGTGTTTVLATTQFINSGNIEVLSGILQLSTQGTHSGTLSVNAGATLNLSSGNFNLTAGGTLAVAGAIRISGGALTLNDPATFANGIELSAGGLTVNSTTETPSLTMSGGTLGGSGVLTVANTFVWTGGTMTGTGKLVSAATGTISGGAGKSLDGGRQLINEGTLTLSGASLDFSNGSGANATFDNRGTFTVTDEADFTWSNFNGQPVFVKNSGTFVKSGTGTTTVLNPTSVANTGTILVDSGTLRFSVSTSHAGPLEIAAGARVELTGGTFTCGAGATLGTLGDFVLQGATLAIPLTLEMPRLSFASGTLAGSAVLTVTEAFAWTGGTLTGTGSLVIGPLANGSISSGAGKSLDGGRQLINEGTLTMSGAGLNLSNGGGANATFDNRGTFTVTDEADFTWSNFNGQPVFVKNSGTFVKSGTGTTSVLAPTQIINSGEIQVLAGVLQLSAQGTQSGALNVSAGATLNLSAGTYTLTTGGTLTAAGAMRITGGTLTLNDPAIFANGIELSAGGFTVNSTMELPSLTMSGGTLAGTGVLTIANAFAWTGGTLTGTGKLVLAPAASGTISGGAGKSLDGGRQLVNEGSLTLSGAGLSFSNGSGGDATLDNRGTFAVTDEADFSWSNFNGQPVFVKNSGTFVKSGVGTTTSMNPTSFTNSGLLSVQGGVLALSPFAQTATGVTQLAGGNLAAGTLTFAAGQVTGVGTISASVTNSGAVFAPGETGNRTLAITGNFTQQAGGTLEFDLSGDAASGAFDKLAVGGAATLSGTVALRNSLALAGEVFPLVSYASRTGTFPVITVTNGGSATASYLTTRADFTVTAGDPPAGAPQLAATYADWINGVNQTWGDAASPATPPNEEGFVFDGAALPLGWDSDPLADPDGDGSVNLLEYAFQTNPLDPESCSRLVLVPDVQQPGGLIATCRLRNAARDIISQLEWSADLARWQPVSADGNGGVTASSRLAAPGINEVTLRLNPATARRTYLRWNVRVGDAP